ncbi:hypothetical protein L2E82_42208 [Cichorium intybus]|uniref:Uncharacterized protein n=1 Tax=Cichorium intybus TaxID=13427 RepID=A0ACB8ZMK9_CICIN|nr:hypothetical protein L2E82_42208 [Cichorium intybus]
MAARGSGDSHNSGDTIIFGRHLLLRQRNLRRRWLVKPGLSHPIVDSNPSLIQSSSSLTEYVSITGAFFIHIVPTNTSLELPQNPRSCSNLA